MELLSRVTMNDTAVSPRPFTGKAGNQENLHDSAFKFLRYFQTFVKLRGLTPAAQLDLFTLLLTDDAADWLNSLPPGDIATLPQLIDEFKKRYLPT